MRASREHLLFRLADARRQVEIERDAGDKAVTCIAIGRADGIAEILELLGVKVPIWIDRPKF